MDTDGRRRRSVTERMRALPPDLVAVLALVILADVLVLIPGSERTFLRAVLGLPLILFLPGYAFIAALFPEAEPVRGDSRSSDERTRTLPRSIDTTERLVLSVGTSVVVSPLIGLVLNYTPWGIRLVSVTLSVSAFTVIAAAAGVLRRQSLPKSERFSLLRERSARIDSATPTTETRTRTDLVLNVAVALSVLLVVSSVVYVVAVPRGGEEFTELSLLTRNGTTDELVADEYPTNFTRGEPKPLVVGVENHERRSANYTVVVALQRIGGRNDSTVVEQRQLRRFRVRVGANESWLHRHTVAPPIAGQRLRLTYLLYRGSAPPNPTVGNAYREVHLWVNVSAPDESGTIGTYRSVQAPKRDASIVRTDRPSEV